MDITATLRMAARLTATTVLTGLPVASSLVLAHGSTALVGWGAGVTLTGGTDVRGTVIRAGVERGLADAAGADVALPAVRSAVSTARLWHAADFTERQWLMVEVSTVAAASTAADAGKVFH